MALRSLLLSLLADMLGVIVTYEQPTSSVLHELPYNARFFGEMNKITTYMGAFGGDTVKPTKLFSTSRKVNALIRKRPAPRRFQKLYRSVTSNGVRKVHGKKLAMKGSSAYTERFGAAVAQAFC
eukprot:9382133-Pyramimonas_sp.AAC.1